MSQVFARRGEDSDVHVYLDVDGEYGCLWCRIQAPDPRTRNAAVMAAHLAEHERGGDKVPPWLKDKLREGGWT